MRNLGRISVNIDLLKQALHIPDTTRIIGVSYDAVCGDSVRLVVEDDALPPVSEGNMVPLYIPLITRHEETYTWDWMAKK